MNFPVETPLADLKKYIEQATQDEAVGLPAGIPIYVDPKGLADADKTMQSVFAVSEVTHIGNALQLARMH